MISFGCVPSMINKYCLLFLFATSLEGRLAPIAVKVKDTAIIPCNGTCNGDASWALTTKNEKVDVLQCVRWNCTEGASFTNRVKLSENVKSGNLSIKLYPVLYNDEGWYEAKCELVFCKFHLEVFVPIALNARVGENVTLPCHARTQKRIADDTVNIIWKKDNQIVLQVQKGIPNYGSAFTGRAIVSLQHYKDGDLSLTLLSVTTSDKGLYRCYHNKEEDHGYPDGITLNVEAHQEFWVKKLGESLTLDLFGSGAVTVTFTGSDATESSVCTVKENNPICSPDYTQRIAVKNDLLILSGLTVSDGGTFTLKEISGEVISINNVTVEGGTRNRFYIYLPALGVLIFICAGLYLYYPQHRRSKAQLAHYRYDAIQQNEMNEKNN